MKYLLSLTAWLGVSAVTALSAFAEQKTTTTNTLSPFWMGASQASAGMVCYAYLNNMITKDEAVHLIFNDCHSVYQMEIDSEGMDVHLDFANSYVAWFRDTLDRTGCDSLKDHYGIGESEEDQKSPDKTE